MIPSCRLYSDAEQSKSTERLGPLCLKAQKPAFPFMMIINEKFAFLFTTESYACAKLDWGAGTPALCYFPSRHLLQAVSNLSLNLDRLFAAWVGVPRYVGVDAMQTG